MATPLLRILADDLTGALDTSAQFVPLLGKLTVGWKTPPEGVEGAAFDNETRNAGEDAAGRAAAAAAHWLRGASVPYKKLDSQLRGASAHEIAAAFQGGDYTHGIIAPAFPAQRRSTRSARQWARDPGASDWRKVGPDLGVQLEALGLDVIRGSGSAALSAPIPEGLSLWDADTSEDLDAVVKAGFALMGPVLWCGCAGLAGALNRHLTGSAAVAPHQNLPGPLLMIIGTARPAALAQIEHLTAQNPGCAIGVDDDAAMARRRLVARLDQGKITLLTFPLTAGTSETMAAQIIVRRMRAVLTRVPRPGALFVTGGETLHTVLECLDAETIGVDGEFEDGIPMGRIGGGTMDGLRLISKSGTFGTTDILSRIAACVS